MINKVISCWYSNPSQVTPSLDQQGFANQRVSDLASERLDTCRGSSPLASSPPLADNRVLAGPVGGTCAKVLKLAPQNASRRQSPPPVSVLLAGPVCTSSGDLSFRTADGLNILLAPHAEKPIALPKNPVIKNGNSFFEMFKLLLCFLRDWFCCIKKTDLVWPEEFKK